MLQQVRAKRVNDAPKAFSRGKKQGPKALLAMQFLHLFLSHLHFDQTKLPRIRSIFY